MNAKEIVCPDLNAALREWLGKGYRLDCLFPADNPHTAMLSRAADTIRVTACPGEPAPGDRLPHFAPEFVLTTGGAGGEGRAGMSYRNLIPSRLGGRYIASHITIPAGGPVDDWVHFHGVAFQLIYVGEGWVRLVYEDQGEPFVMQAGDVVLQPPFIRHRVLESSPGLEVIEIGCPAIHMTYSEHGLELPNGRNPQRLFAGQRFLHQVAADTPWTPFSSGEAQESSIREATRGLADVRTIRSTDEARLDFPAHDGELVFGFVLDGSARLVFGDGHPLAATDAFVIPPGQSWSLADASPAFRLLHVTTAAMPAQIPASP